MSSSEASSRPGRLFVISAPSGTGKTTVARRLVESVDEIVMSRSYTSRPAREGEVDGVDYNFLDPERFAAMVDEGAFLEWATIFGHRYGTSAADTEAHQREGRDVVLVIDVQGARQLRAQGTDAVGVFVLPPSFAELKARLLGRDPTASSRDLTRRLETARLEVAERRFYDYIVVNHRIEDCVDRVRAIVLAERARADAMAPRAQAIADSFVVSTEA